MSGLPWMRFYPADWRAEATLRLVSREARSLWIDLVCLIHEGSDGRLHIGGANPSEKQLASILGDNPRTVRKLIAELEAAGVCSRNADGFIVSRRIVRDLEKAERDKSNGRTGGNPALKTNGLAENRVNPADKAQKPEARDQNPEKDKSVSKKRTVYPDDFEGFWRAYPDTTNNTKSRALHEWRALSEEDQGAALAALPRYAAHCRKTSTAFLHAERYLKYRRFDSLSATPGHTQQEEEAARLEGFLDDAFWSPSWGPRPDDPRSKQHDEWRRRQSSPAKRAEGDRAQRGGGGEPRAGAQTAQRTPEPIYRESESPPLRSPPQPVIRPLHHASHGPPPPQAGEDYARSHDTEKQRSEP